MDDEYAEITRQLAVLMRRVGRLHAAGDDLVDRSAYFVLGRLVNGGPARLSALAAELALDLSVVSRQVATLEAAGLVDRAPDPADRRASLITASEAGVEAFDRKRERFVALLRAALKDWSAADRRQFAQLFARFNEAMISTHGSDAWVRR